MSPQTMLIIGAGIFGASTAYHLSLLNNNNNDHKLKILLFDRTPSPNPAAASNDINKIVRVGYNNIHLCRLAWRSLTAWRTDPFFNQWFHPTGLLSFLPHRGGAETVMRNFATLGLEGEGAEIVTPEVVREWFGGVFREAEFGGTRELMWEPGSGWMDAAAALEGTVRAAVRGGVEFVGKGVVRVVIDEGGVCRGVETGDGTRYWGDNVLLCAGAETARILADSAPMRLDLHAGNRFVAAAIIVAKVKLTEEQLQTYGSTPSVLWDEEPVRGEIVPVTEDGYLKFIRDIPVKNTVYHPESQTWISRPPESEEGTGWTHPKSLPQKLQDEMRDVIEGIVGSEAAKTLQPDELRLCWEPLSPDENWFLTPHPRCEGLYIATAGSGHGWKHLPVIGELIIEMMLEPEKFQQRELAGMWAWDREIVESPDEDFIPKRELRDLV